MAEFLTTNGTSYYIEKIMIDAKKELFLVSPYLQLSKTFFERLKDADNRNVEIKIIYGKDDLDFNEKKNLSQLKNIYLFYFENLHAKCYFNESEMVITSMNMYEFSEKNNREMGIFISKNKDSKIFHSAVTETFSIIDASQNVPLSKTKKHFQKNKIPTVGYCIRCSKRIPYEVEAPYCRDCFRVWEQFQNVNYMENVCHCCGNNEFTTIIRPLCHKCYSLQLK